MTVKYTDQQLSELRSVGLLNYEIATVFAEKHGIAVRSVIAKARSLEIPYQPKDPTSRSTSKPKAESKDNIVKSIQTALGTDKLASLNKMTVQDLLVLRTLISD